MSDTNKEIDKIERKINLIKLMIEKRSKRIEYYEKLIKMGLASGDKKKLDFSIIVKQKEIKDLTEELDWLYMQKSFYELQNN